MYSMCSFCISWHKASFPKEKLRDVNKSALDISSSVSPNKAGIIDNCFKTVFQTNKQTQNSK